MRTSPPPPQKKTKNKEELHNLDFSTFSKLINWKKITGHWVIPTIFDSNHVRPYGIFNDNCVHLCSIGLHYTQEETLNNGEDEFFVFWCFFNLSGAGALPPPPPPPDTRLLMPCKSKLLKFRLNNYSD